MNLKFRQFFLLAIPLRTAIAQVSVGALLLSALVLMFMARNHAEWLDRLRLQVNAGIQPALVFVQTPVQVVEDWLADLQQLTVLQQENKSMQDEMSGLRTWHLQALRLESENRALRNLLGMKQTHEVTSTACNVLSDNGSSFGHSVLVAVPADFRLQPGLVAMTGDGMVGRTIEFSDAANLARVLLLDDPASRIPVVLENSKATAILAGHSAGHLSLENLPSGTPAAVGELVLSAGNDGVLPPGLPLARVTDVAPDHITIKSIAPLDRLDWLRLVDFGTATILTKPSFNSPH